MGQRIKLAIVNGQLILMVAIACEALRMKPRLMTFVIDTGSSESLLSHSTTVALQISLTGRTASGQIRFGGATFDKITLPAVEITLLSEAFEKISLPQVKLSALKTNRVSQIKKEIAQSLPSVLGTDFLSSHGLALHYLPKENLAYLETE